MITVSVELGHCSYPIHIGAKLLAQSELYKPHVKGSKLFIVTNETVADLYLEKVKQAMSAVGEVHATVLPDGEIHKQLSTIESIIDQMLAIPCDRKTTVVALGGGVVGDIAGFTAACYQRGVPCIQIPTTLLSQVDSAVGGKTGVNHPRGKNMIGAFHQPVCVVSDSNTLSSLPEREFRAGIAEIIKYGLIRDHEFFKWLENNMDLLINRDKNAVAFAVEQSCRNKAYVVAEDERESGLRAILNFGHTFGHAIETGLNYEDWLHGEAVAAGMVMASEFSRRLEWLTSTENKRIVSLISKTGLPVSPPPTLQPDYLKSLMKVDKKSESGAIKFVLLKGIGQAEVTSDYSDSILNSTIQSFLQ